MNVSQSALDAEDSTPPIPQKLFLDDEFGDDPPPPIPPKLFLDDEFDDNPPPPIPPKLFLDNEDYSLPISHMKLPKSRGPQQTGKNPSSQWQTILVLLQRMRHYRIGGLLLHCAVCVIWPARA